ncbi:transporter, major facilitator family protein, partial [Dictyocaulus viviparus]
MSSSKHDDGMNNDQQKKSISSSSLSKLDERQSPWKSLWISIGLQYMIGIQISIYFMSMWPYLSGLDSTATVDFFGWVVAACSLGCSIANPLFGWWNQKTLDMKSPIVVGMALMAIGQFIYGFLPLFDSNQKWIMMFSRLTTGFGAGTLSVLRAYTATASVPRDRLRAVSFGTAGLVLGLSSGPAIQAIFTIIGEDGFTIGSMIFNMYTLPAFFMVLLSFVCSVVVITIFKEDYVGIINQDKDKSDESYVVIPKFDLIPALICIYLWIIASMVEINTAVISTPWTSAMYNWKDSDAVLYNGIFQTLSCLMSATNSIIIGHTRVGKIEKRKQIIFGISMFLLFHIITYPWPFYDGPLTYIPSGKNSSEVGGCLPSYDWCDTTVRVPLPLFIICMVIIFGIAFPFSGSPAGTLFSEILGPRRQGMMQGIYSFGGSMAQFVTPIFTTYLFQHYGYKYIMMSQIFAIGFALFLIVVFYGRLVPLKLKPSPGKATKYK